MNPFKLVSGSSWHDPIILWPLVWHVRVFFLITNIMIKIRKLTLVCYDHLILKSHSRSANCSYNVLYKKKISSELHVAFSYHISLFFFTLELLLSSSLIFMTLMLLKSSYFVKYPLVEVCLMFPHDQTQVVFFWWEYHKCDAMVS